MFDFFALSSSAALTCLQSCPQERYTAVGTCVHSSFSQKKTQSCRAKRLIFKYRPMAHVSLKKTLEELKTEAIAELERRGLEVRGKTPTQIRKLLRLRSKKRSPKQTGSGWRTERLGD
jgi:hypothetical protein